MREHRLAEMTTIGPLLVWIPFVLGAAWLWALGLGRARLHGVRDARDARNARILIGALAVIFGIILAFGYEPIEARIVGLMVTGGGIATFASAFGRLPAADETTAISKAALAAAAQSGRRGLVRASRAPLDIHPSWGWTIFLALVAGGCAVAYVFGAWDAWADAEKTLGDKIGFTVTVGLIFGTLLIGPTVWWVLRVVRRKPFLRIDDWGVTFGNDRNADPGIRWDEISEIEARWIRSQGVSERTLILKPHDPERVIARARFAGRVLMRISRAIYGSPIVISTTALAIPFETLLAHIEAHYGPLNASPMSGRTV